MQIKLNHLVNSNYGSSTDTERIFPVMFNEAVNIIKLIAISKFKLLSFAEYLYIDYFVF